jgi:dTDP-glucose 4,6-dehydratase
VDDVVDAYLLVAEAMFEGTLPYGEIYNVGAPAVDAQTVVGLIQQLMGEKGQVAILGESNDQHNEAMDSTKIEKLGWKPQHMLEEGLSKTIEWFQEHARVKVMI